MLFILFNPPNSQNECCYHPHFIDEAIKTLNVDKLGYQLIDTLKREFLENNFNQSESRPTCGFTIASYACK